jgi:uncharacterized protein YdbL (DUF1318 family)
MSHRAFKLSVLVVLATVFLIAADSFAGDIKARMKARQPIIKALKARGIIAENNKGYLEFISDLREKEDVVIAENNDRKKVYTAIAKKTGTSADLVGMRRAKKIAKREKP